MEEQHSTTPRHAKTVAVTARQEAVLTSLTAGDLTIAAIVWDWPGLSYSAAHSRVAALESKGLVRKVRFDGVAWEWGLTTAGTVVAGALDEHDV